MAKKKNKRNLKATEVTSKEYKSPSERWWGQVLVWGIIIGMVGVVIASLVVTIINYLK